MAPSTPSNDLRATLEDGDVALGLLENTYNPTLVEFYGDLGVDFVWIDLEHGGPSARDAAAVENLLRAAERTDVELLVRLPDSDPTLVRKALDLGVRNVFLPRVETAEEVREAVRSSRFHYDGGAGDRGLAGPRARRWGLADDYVETEDDETLVGATIETREAIANLEDILAVPELGFVFLGPLDLSAAYGRPGELDDPDVAEAVETARTTALDADVPVGGLGFGMEDVESKAADGYQILNLGTTTAVLEETVSGWLESYDGPARGGD